ncbi:MAG: hypothetical protein HUJ26_07630 [Planctomycetaceae bacterium]|nr:hypothetical protein [Planctomycetaceae bacterium]
MVAILMGGVLFFWKEISAARLDFSFREDQNELQEVNLESLRSPIFDLAISPFGDVLIYRNHHGIVNRQNLVNDTQDGSPSGEIDPGGRCELMLLSPIENKLVSALDDGQIILDDLNRPGSEQTVLANSGGVPECMAFSPDGRFVAGGLENGTVIVWDVVKNTTATVFRRKRQNPSSLIFDSQMGLFVSFESGLERWQLTLNDEFSSSEKGRGNQRQMDWRIDQPAAREMILTNDGKVLIAASFDNHVRCWDLESRELKWEFRGVLPCARSLRFSPDESFFVCQSEVQTLHFRDVETGEELASLEDSSMGTGTGARFSLDGKLLYSASSDGLIRIWTVPGRALIGTVETDALQF